MTTGRINQVSTVEVGVGGRGVERTQSHPPHSPRGPPRRTCTREVRGRRRGGTTL